VPLSRELLEYLQSLETASFSGSVYRHMFGERPPTLENTLGARWNPPGVAAIYVSLERETVIAEGDHALAVQPLRPRIARWVYSVTVELSEVLDLSASDALKQTGVGSGELGGDDHAPCRAVGEAVAWLGYEGLLVPSARADGTNLVIFTANLKPDAVFDVGEREAVEK
jgi:RES domain-containing protein